MEEVEELKKRVAMLETLLTAKESVDYDVIVVRKPEPLPPARFTGYWNIYNTPRKCHAHVRRSWEAAKNACFGHCVDIIRVDWQEGKTEGRWVSVKHEDID